jgi:hypothetical protein
VGKGTHRRLAAMAGLAAAVALVVGEATTSPAGAMVLATSASSVFDPAAAATLAGKTVQVSFSISGSIGGSVSGGGPFNLKTDTGEYTLHLSIPGATGVAPQQVTAVEILAGNELYLKLPTNLGGSAAKPWTKTSLSSFGASSAEAKDEDPAAFLPLLAKYATNVTKIGPATVGGQATTEYSATIDPGAFPGAPAAAKTLGSLPIKVWLDSKHRLAQLSETISTPSTTPAAVPTTAGPTTSTVTLGFSHYGEPVHVTVPPASEVTTE